MSDWTCLEMCRLRPVVILLLVVLALLLAACDVETASRPTATARTTTTSASSKTLANATRAQVVRVVDGDTVIVRINGREDRLRYIGIDTPETVKQNSPVECYGKEASRANTQLVDGAAVYLVKDVSDRDQYDRLLRYVYVDNPEGGEPIFVNRWLVEQGYAEAVTFPPDVAHAADLRAAERDARTARRGLWGSCPAP
jgi:micrococcal nuclease